MPFLILPTFAFVYRPQRAQSTNDRHIESFDSKCLSISSALTRAARTADCGFGHLLRWRTRSVKHQFNYGGPATGESEAASPTRHAFTPSTLREKSPIRRPSKSPNHAMQPTRWPHAQRIVDRRRDARQQRRLFARENPRLQRSHTWQTTSSLLPPVSKLSSSYLSTKKTAGRCGPVSRKISYYDGLQFADAKDREQPLPPTAVVGFKSAGVAKDRSLAANIDANRALISFKEIPITQVEASHDALKVARREIGGLAVERAALINDFEGRQNPALLDIVELDGFIWEPDRNRRQ